MKLYLLVNEQDTDNGFGANAAPYTDQEAAQAALREDWENALKSWGFDTSLPETDDHYCECKADHAVIHDGNDGESWHIEEHEVSVNVAVEVIGGMVTNVYADADLHVQVYDMDVSDFPDKGEQDAVDAKAKELETLTKSPGWGCVW